MIPVGIIIRKTWLSRKPLANDIVAAALTTSTLILISMVYWWNVLNAKIWMAAEHDSVFLKHEYGRLLTTLFVHGDEKHLLSNSFLFFILGYFLRSYFGLFVFPFMAFVFGAMINFFVLLKMPPGIQLIGASGVVFWMGGAWLTLYFCIDRTRSIFGRSLRAIGVGLVMFFPTDAFDPTISYQSHFVGLALGILFGAFYYFLHRRKYLAAEVIETIFEEDPNQSAKY